MERKLSQMIMDGKLRGILDQGRGRLIVYEEGEKDMAMEGGLEVIAIIQNSELLTAPAPNVSVLGKVVVR